MLLDGMSFDKYIDNPSGGASVINNRQMYKDLYRSKFEKVLLKEGGGIKYSVYHADDKNDSYYIYFKIPSESIDNFYYDVVIHLFTHMMPKKVNMTLRQYQVEFYSNDPAFTYTHVHAFAKNHLFIKDLEHKMSSKALSEKAKERNPKDNVWYVKSLYFAYLAMEKYGLFNRATLQMISKPYSKHVFDNKIVHADTKIKARQDAAAKAEKAKAESRSNEIKEYNDSRNLRHKTQTSKVSTVSKVSKISKTTKVTKKR